MVRNTITGIRILWNLVGLIGDLNA